MGVFPSTAASSVAVEAASASLGVSPLGDGPLAATSPRKRRSSSSRSGGLISRGAASRSWTSMRGAAEGSARSEAARRPAVVGHRALTRRRGQRADDRAHVGDEQLPQRLPDALVDATGIEDASFEPLVVALSRETSSTSRRSARSATTSSTLRARCLRSASSPARLRASRASQRRRRHAARARARRGGRRRSGARARARPPRPA